MKDEHEHEHEHEHVKRMVKKRISGVLTWVGDMTVNGDHISGFAIEIPREKLATAGPLPIYAEVEISWNHEQK